MQYYDVTLAASGALFTVHAPGRYIKYLTGTAGGNDTSIVVTPGMQGGSKITLSPGQAYRLDDNAPIPDSWTLSNNLGQSVITGRVVVGNGRIDDNSLQGIVQVVDGGKSRSLSGNAFSVFGSCNAVSSVFSRVQLWNPVGNPNRLVIEAITLLAGAANQTANLIFNAPNLATAGNPGQAKFYGKAASLATIYSDTNAANAGGASLMALGALAYTSPTYRLSEPIIVPPGEGLTLWGSQANAYLGATFEWYEEPNV